MALAGPCPICGTPVEKRSPTGTVIYYVCPRCGTFGLTVHAESIALPPLLTTRRNRSVLSYAISKTPGTGHDTHVFNAEECARILGADFLPSPHEQAETLLRWIGDNLDGTGETTLVGFAQHGDLVGARSDESFRFIVQGLIDSHLVKGFVSGGGAAEVTLTFEGWNRYDQLRRGTSSGRKAFIAMEYGHADLDTIVNNHFKAAVAETGFVLRRLDDEQPAGLIDDRLRVEIQSSRFLIVDLTHSNVGAYWEAGYAEGLRKPVIYTCEESTFKKTPSHFDTNHHLHVLWDASDIQPALSKLRATIRATIPEATRE